MAMAVSRRNHELRYRADTFNPVDDLSWTSECEWSSLFGLTY
jgi:hypothetical protein